MLKFLFPAVILIALSCSIHTKELFYSEPENYTIDTIVRTYTVDYTARLTGGSDLITYRDETWIMLNFCGAGKLTFLNLHKDSVIEIQVNNPECKKLFTAIKKEGIYVIMDDGRVLLYPHGSKIPGYLFKLTDIPEFNVSGLKPEWYKPGADQQINIPVDIVYFRINQDYDDENGTYSKYDIAYPISAKLNVKTKAIEFFGKTPRYVAHGDYGFLSDIYDLYIGDSIFYSKPINGEITLINTTTGSATEFDIPSSYQYDPVKEFHFSPLKKAVNQRDKKMAHSTYSAYYEALFYNPYDEHYYRIFHPEMPKYNADGLLNTGFDKGNVLMVFDRNLKLIEEVVLPLKYERVIKLHPLQNGVELLVPGAMTVEKSNVTFQLLRITRK